MGLIWWNTAPLDAAIARGFALSLRAVQAEADATSGSKDATASVHQTGPTTAVVRPEGRIGAIREEGARPHEISPGAKGYLYVGGGKFVSGTVSHPGSAPAPYIAPAVATWRAGGFHASARAALLIAGFR